MVRRIVALLGLLLLIGSAAPAAAQDLPEYTPDQRWARAEYMANGWIVMAIRQAKATGQSVDQLAQATFEAFDPAWKAEMGPQDMLVAINRNWMWQRQSQVEVLESSPAQIRARGNRPYTAYFGPDDDALGVSASEYEHLLDVFYQKICAKRGMTYEQRVEGDWVYITVKTR